MRKIWLSSKVWCSESFSFTALARLVPNGFSMMMRARSARPTSPRPRTTPARPRAARSDSGDGRRHRRARLPARPRSSRALRCPPTGRRRRAGRESSHSSSGTPWCENSSSAARANSRKPSSSRSSSDEPTMRHSGNRPACARWNMPGRSLRREIAGRAEQHHHVRAQRRDQIRVDVGGPGISAAPVTMSPTGTGPSSSASKGNSLSRRIDLTSRFETDRSTGVHGR